MNRTFSDVLTTGQLFPVTDDFKLFIPIALVSSLGLISTFGLVSNILNMIVFVKLVLKDSMAVELFSLAFADFWVCCLNVIFIIIYVCSVVYPLNVIDLWALAFTAFVWATIAAYLISSWLTALISLERCFSVVFPFKVRQLFTKLRCVLVVIAIYVINIAIFIPGFVIEKLEWVFYDFENVSGSSFSQPQGWIYTLVITEALYEVDTVLDITADICIFMLSQIIIFGCTVWMIHALNLSSTVRTKKVNSGSNKLTLANTRSQLTKQETRLIKIVLFLSILHLACNLPRLSLVIFYHTFPWTNVDSQKNVITIMAASINIFGSITCSSTFFGYCNLNSKYKQALYLLWT